MTFLYVLHLAIGLRSVSVSKPEELESYLNEGYRERTIASTNMNNYSSRAHTIATIHLLQMQASEEVSLSSQMNIVDLAGRWFRYMYIVFSINILIKRNIFFQKIYTFKNILYSLFSAGLILINCELNVMAKKFSGRKYS